MILYDEKAATGYTENGYDRGSPTPGVLMGENEDGQRLFAVGSWRSDTKAYVVNIDAPTPSCTCPHFVTRLAEKGEKCKHIENLLAAERQRLSNCQ